MSIVAQGESARTYRSDYETPDALLERVATRLGAAFALDVAATIETSKATVYYGPDSEAEAMRDGLAADWHDFPRAWCWMNPPYGRGIERWTVKATREAACGCTVVGLLPGNAWGSGWWQRTVLSAGEHRGAHEIYPVAGRIRFLLDGKVQPAPANDNAIVVWRPGVPPAVPTLRAAISAS